MGDHIMPIDRPEPRNVYLRFIDDSGLPPAKRDVVTHFDVFPSILDALGLLPASSPRLAFGASVFADVVEYDDLLHTLQTGILSRRSLIYQRAAIPKAEPQHPVAKVE